MADVPRNMAGMSLAGMSLAGPRSSAGPIFAWQDQKPNPGLAATPGPAALPAPRAGQDAAASLVLLFWGLPQPLPQGAGCSFPRRPVGIGGSDSALCCPVSVPDPGPMARAGPVEAAPAP